MVTSTVIFEIKSEIRDWSDQDILINANEKNISISIKKTECKLLIKGNDEKDNLDYIYLIWELLAWQDGYFYKPLNYCVNNIEKDPNCLLKLKYFSSDSQWIDDSILLCRNKRQINDTIIENYKSIRFLDRIDSLTNASMFSSFFYLISESYNGIMLEHRLALLMHICDGFAINCCDGAKNNCSANIRKILDRLNLKKIKYGAMLLGVPSSKFFDALGDARNELTHYVYKKGSIGSFISNSDTNTDNMVYLYVFYILTLALRIAVLEKIGITVEEEIKNYAMNEYLDWIKLEKNLDEACVNPRNVLRQTIKNFNKQMGNHK